MLSCGIPELKEPEDIRWLEIVSLCVVVTGPDCPLAHWLADWKAIGLVPKILSEKYELFRVPSATQNYNPNARF